MAVMASAFGVIGSVGGLYGSAYFDTPSGPSIILASALILAIVMILPRPVYKLMIRRGAK
jgi:zinc transport system permease protein